MKKIHECIIRLNNEVSPNHYRLVLQNKDIPIHALPGQFVMLEVSTGYYPFLRRPMSIERIFHDGISILYKVCGEGTKILSTLSAGEKINVQGPLGNSFPLPEDNKRSLIVAGGIGVAPFPALVEKILNIKGIAPEVILAGKTFNHLLCEKDFRQMGCKIHLVTEDGSAGYNGMATDFLKSLDLPENILIYTCGPLPMIKNVHEICNKNGWLCYASLEAEMACGEGVCLGCVLPARIEVEKEMMVRVCKEGPIFDTRIILWDKIGEE
ncbi:MAG TPA: dihydroorotate dehydrogenase electron transfer subunit [Candidatus Hydrogenedens sp.]|nr:dihydroorotate dehydrogenase electron transfer subunit [Candidatus Hydrogenedens sp.]HOL18920.1 dihydroorotate dehydrogenase electron transfer subunit [Candidatus Hydrogenedens sp.]HPP57580.1 dihydroorotate dehydrogenase electron transfer subunit [Candidatus Hydrogenedens sp.]